MKVLGSVVLMSTGLILAVGAFQVENPLLLVLGALAFLGGFTWARS